MQVFTYILFSILSFFTSVYGLDIHPSDKEREEISDIVSLFVENWNQHNPQGMASLWLEEGDLMAADGRWARSRNEVEQLFLQEQIGCMRNSSLNLTVQNICFFAPNVAWVDANGTILNINDEVGINRTFEHHVIFVIVKENDRWSIAAVRPYQLFAFSSI